MNFNTDSFVWLTDRTTLGGDEMMIDGQPLVFKAGEIRKYVPRELVLWLYRHDKRRVWTTDGQWVHRYAVEDPPQGLIDQCGAEVGDCSPIEVDRARIEGWDTTGVPRNERTRVVPVSIPMNELRDRLPAPALTR
jgi:hypothetical protein